MTDSPDTVSPTRDSLPGKVVKPSHTRGYVPKGTNPEPDQAPIGAAGTSIPVSEQENTAQTAAGSTRQDPD